MEMEFEGQEVFEYTSFNRQVQWIKSNHNTNCNSWNQNMTEAMMNSYSNVPNCHTGMYYHPPQQPQGQYQPQYDYYQHQQYYFVNQSNNNGPIHSNYDYQMSQQQQLSGNFGDNYIHYETETWDTCTESHDLNFNTDGQSSSSLDTSSSVESVQHQHPIRKNEEKQEEECDASHYHCFVCNMRFARLYHLKRHFECALHKAAVEENNCQDPAECLLQFYKQPKENQKYGCQMCSKKYKTKVSLKRHLHNIHNVPKNSKALKNIGDITSTTENSLLNTSETL